MSRTIHSNNSNIPLFHPTIFETTISDTPNDTNAVLEIEREHLKRLNTDDLYKLKSPGSFEFTQENHINNNNTKYLRIEESLLTFLFFCKKNIDNIQNIVQYKVYKETQNHIDKQSAQEILIIMRSIYLEYSQHPPILHENMDEKIKQKVLKMYTDEVKRLNEIVIEYIYPKVLNGLQQYIGYLRDASTLPYQIQQPDSSDNINGQRQYRSITQVLLGTKL